MHAQLLHLCPTLCNPMDYRLLCSWDSPGKNPGVSCHVLLQGLFLTQGSKPLPLCLLHWQVPLGKPLKGFLLRVLPDISFSMSCFLTFLVYLFPVLTINARLSWPIFFPWYIFWKHHPRNHLSHGNTPNQAKQWQALVPVLQESTIQVEIHSHHSLRIRSILLLLALQPAPGFLAVIIIPTADQGVGTVKKT